MNKGDDPRKQRGIDNGVRGWATISCIDVDYNFKLDEEKVGKWEIESVLWILGLLQGVHQEDTTTVYRNKLYLAIACFLNWKY